MTERERLIKLLMQGDFEADKQGIFNCSLSRWKAEIIADYLIKNGIIFRTCEACEYVYIHKLKCCPNCGNKIK